MSRHCRFKESMESVYGKTADIPDPDAWVPPINPGGLNGRYLWTDAFGVLNFLTLNKESPQNDRKYLTLAKRLVCNVHDTLGHTRDRTARLPGATDSNPLGGGLRIGKVSETGPDGDGQYHHYLTLWMFALNRLSMATGDASYNFQAISLAKAIHPRFVVERASNAIRMVWKMSMDLSEPLVENEGHLDPIDGYLVFRLLQSSAASHGEGQILSDEIEDYARIMDRKKGQRVSSDTLDLGMSMWTAHWLAAKETWAADLRAKCLSQLRTLFGAQKYLGFSVASRTAYRDFGTCLGIDCACYTGDAGDGLQTYSETLISQWEKNMSSVMIPENLRPITMVMYCTALIPGAFKAGYFGPEPIREIAS